MKILITGICGFTGNALAHRLLVGLSGLELFGVDNLSRAGGSSNLNDLRALGATVFHGDLRMPSDVDALPDVDWVIDCAANPSVLAGLTGRAGARQLMENNLFGTVNLLEYVRRAGAGFILLSTSRVYSISELNKIDLEVRNGAFHPRPGQSFPAGLSPRGLAEGFPTTAPVSLYGASKLASEVLALEYGHAFGLPVRINRCGVLAGAGQFGRPDQGIFAYWIHSWKERRPLSYLGFGGLGHQVRDLLHPADLADLLMLQIEAGSDERKPSILHVSGGLENSLSLQQLSGWCEARFGSRVVTPKPETRAYDLPWLVLDNGLARETWGWKPRQPYDSILEEIACHAETFPHWLEHSII